MLFVCCVFGVGIYVLHDLQFRCVSRVFALSGAADGGALVDAAKVYVSLACGILRGALWNLGLNASVKADIHKLPAVQFTIMEEKAAANAAPAAARAAHGAPSAAATAVAAATAHSHTHTMQPRTSSAGLPPTVNATAAATAAAANRPRTSLGGGGGGSGAPAPRSVTGTPTRG